MVENVHGVIEQWTGTAPQGCPWAAFLDPFVVRVVRSSAVADDGYLELYEPDPSNRLIEGLAFYKRCRASVESKRMQQERERAQSQRATTPGTEVIRG